jgi:hypothetical protein
MMGAWYAFPKPSLGLQAPGRVVDGQRDGEQRRLDPRIDFPRARGSPVRISWASATASDIQSV